MVSEYVRSCEDGPGVTEVWEALASEAVRVCACMCVHVCVCVCVCVGDGAREEGRGAWTTLHVALSALFCRLCEPHKCSEAFHTGVISPSKAR